MKDVLSKFYAKRLVANQSGSMTLLLLLSVTAGAIGGYVLLQSRYNNSVKINRKQVDRQAADYHQRRVQFLLRHQGSCTESLKDLELVEGKKGVAVTSLSYFNGVDPPKEQYKVGQWLNEQEAPAKFLRPGEFRVDSMRVRKNLVNPAVVLGDVGEFEITLNKVGTESDGDGLGEFAGASHSLRRFTVLVETVGANIVKCVADQDDSMAESCASLGGTLDGLSCGNLKIQGGIKVDSSGDIFVIPGELQPGYLSVDQLGTVDGNLTAAAGKLQDADTASIDLNEVTARVESSHLLTSNFLAGNPGAAITVNNTGQIVSEAAICTNGKCRRFLDQSCPANQFIHGINEDGTVDCKTFESP